MNAILRSDSLVGPESLARCSLVGGLLLALSGIDHGQQPGQVLFHQKISDTMGGMEGQLSGSDSFGVVEAIGDLDGDGITDLAVGAPGNQGSVWILFLNRDGTVRARTEIMPPAGVTTGEAFGNSVACLGDLNGARAIAVGTLSDEGIGPLDTGSVWIFRLDSTGGVVSPPQRIAMGSGGFSGALAMGDFFGVAVAPLGDLDSDGLCDLAVGASLDDTNGNERGAVYILYMNAEGTVKPSFQKIADNTGGFGSGLTDSDQFGSAICSLGDLGDGALTLAVGARNDRSDGVGAAWILFLDTSAQVISQTKLNTLPGFPGAAGFFGTSVENLGNLDGVGAVELAVGADHENNAEGAFFVFRLSVTGSAVSILSSLKIGEGTGNFMGFLDPCNPCPGAGDLFGYVAALGDLDLDGRIDIAVGAPFDDDGGTDQGAVWILFLNDGSVDLSSVTTWEGDSGGPSTDWTRNMNWSASAPTSTRTAIIPATTNLPIIPSGVSAACRHLIIQPGASVTLGSATSSLAIHGGATLQGPISGPGAVNFQGAGTLAGTATLTAGLGITCNADISLQGGPLVVGVGTTFKVNQDLAIEAGAALECNGTAVLQSNAGGTLSGSGMLDCEGELTLNILAPAPPRIEVAGDLRVHSGSFQPGAGVIRLDGSVLQTVRQSGGLIPFVFHDLELAPTADVVFERSLEVYGNTLWEGAGESTGSISFFGDVTSVPAFSSSFGGSSRRITPTIQAGDIYVYADFFMVDPIVDPSGDLVIDTTGGVTVSISQLIDGDVLVIGNGDATLSGGVFAATGDFELMSGRVLSDGDLELTVQSLSIAQQGIFDVQGHRIDVFDDPAITVLGDLLVAPGGDLALSACDVVVGNGGLLSLSGASGNPAALCEADETAGGYTVHVQSGGMLVAGDFLMRRLGADFTAGLTIDTGALLGPSPFDLRNGTFEDIASANGAGFLDIERPPGPLVELFGLRFTGGVPMTTYNVSVSMASAVVRLTDWSGDFGGTSFEPGVDFFAEWGTELLSLTCQETAAANVLRWNTGRRGEAEKYVLVRAPAAFPSPVELAPAGPPIGFQSYQYSDPSPGVAYVYQLFERFPGGALRLLGTVRATPPRVAPPSPPVFVPFPTGVVPAQVGEGPVTSPAGTFAGVPEALAALPGEDAVLSLELARGMHPAFELRGGSVAIRAAGGGEAWIDVSHGPVRIVGLAPGDSVELAGLRLVGAAPGAPALVVEDCRGLVRLEDVEADELLVRRSQGVLLRNCRLGRLHLEPDARAFALEGSLASASIAGGARLESWGLAGETVQLGPGTWRAQAKPAVTLALLDEDRSGLRVELRAPAGSRAWLLAAQSPRFGVAREGLPLLLDPRALVQLRANAPVGASGALSHDLQHSRDTSGPIYLQALVLDPATGRVQLSDLVRSGSR